MKSLIWKIIALASLFMGGLGPQIAVGSPLDMPAETPVVEQAAAIPVVTAASDTQIVVQGMAGECVSAGLQLGRFDLLLWSDCETSLTISTATAEQEVVVAAPQAWPELSVVEGPYKSITNTFEPWASSDNLIGGFAYQVSIETKNRISFSVRQSSLGLAENHSAGFSSGNSQQNVVLRC